MRRENRKHNKVNSNKTVFITGGILLLAIATFIITFVVYSNKLDNDLYSFDSEYLAQYSNTINDNNIGDDKQTKTASSAIGQTVEESKKETDNNTIRENTSKVTDNSKKTSQKVSIKTTSSNKNKVEKDPTFIKPIEGDILKEYA